ncbi:MAG: carbamoyltransferase HypF [Verrucomicrobiota bacterium]
MHAQPVSADGPQSGSARIRLVLRGAVQGVGYRPFVYRLASEMALQGWVSNSAQGLIIEAEAAAETLRAFVRRLEAEKPAQSVLQSVEFSGLAPAGYLAFEIRESEAAGPRTTLVLPDLATCSDCLQEIFNPADRRYRYPFTNCTQCGPRFTIMEGLPYDRKRTSMRRFPMCAQCQAEYDDPRNRRFHAQPNACPVCGPRLEFWDSRGQCIGQGEPALEQAAVAIGRGDIVAVKGLGGFQLVVAAHREDRVARLRRLKHREEKPFALLFASLDSIRDECEVTALEAEMLVSTQAPIVLLRRRGMDSRSAICPSVAPGNPFLGVMLPANPIQHLLLRRIGFTVVATSGNVAEEPICIDEEEAVHRLAGLADYFLVHNRPIIRHADDSIARVVAGQAIVLRRARGYAPLPVSLPELPSGATSASAPRPTVLATGGHLKNCIGLAIGQDVFVSQHIGDLETLQAYAAFQRVTEDFQSFYGVRPDLVAADAHPDYLSTRYALDMAKPVVRVQHHYAHVLACLAEHRLTEDEILGVAWDGTGYGTDGSIWGGEFLTLTPAAFRRVAHWRTFRLPGGEWAAREPRRAALGLLYEMEGAGALRRSQLAPVRSFSAPELRNVLRMLQSHLNAPLTSSVGRLFDGVASLLGMRQKTSYEGQAAMELEFALDQFDTQAHYPTGLKTTVRSRANAVSATEPEASGDVGPEPWVLDWQPIVQGLLDDMEKGLPPGMISLKVHLSLVEAIVQVAQKAGKPHVVLSGGCFQNKFLVERALARLNEAGFHAHFPRLVPPNDGGIALGQVLAARRTLRGDS